VHTHKQAGPFTSIHPRNKKLVGKRLAAAALDLVYNIPTQWMPPVYKSSTATGSGTTLTVSVEFDNVPTRLVAAADHCKTEMRDADGHYLVTAECAWFSIVASDTSVLNATATVSTSGKAVVLTATAAKAGLTVRVLQLHSPPRVACIAPETERRRVYALCTVQMSNTPSLMNRQLACEHVLSL
jgi:hypothetical protein